MVMSFFVGIVQWPTPTGLIQETGLLVPLTPCSLGPYFQVSRGGQTCPSFPPSLQVSLLDWEGRLVVDFPLTLLQQEALPMGC